MPELPPDQTSVVVGEIEKAGIAWDTWHSHSARPAIRSIAEPALRSLLEGVRPAELGRSDSVLTASVVLLVR